MQCSKYAVLTHTDGLRTTTVPSGAVRQSYDFVVIHDLYIADSGLRTFTLDTIYANAFE